MPPILRLAVLAFGLVAVPANALDVRVPGKLLRIVARSGAPAVRTLAFRTGATPAVAPPFGDPTAGASLLLFSSNQSSGCRLETALPAANWTAIGGDPARGWRYADPAAAAAGVRKVVVKAGAKGGRIAVKATGTAMPCALSAAQPVPFEVTLRLGAVRYCASFGGEVRRNEPGRFTARRSAPPLACHGTGVRVASLNVLHGLSCPAPTANCRLADRIALLGQWIVDRNCPDVVALQEVWSSSPGTDVLTHVQAQLVNACPQPYAVAFQQTFPADDSLVLSRYSVAANAVIDLHGPIRHAQHARIDHPVGFVDVFSTHLAAGVDGGSQPCAFFSPCPPECIAGGAVTVRDCQALQLAHAVAAAHDVDGPAFVVGDLNAPPGSFVYDQFAGVLGAIDTFLAAGNAECDAGSGAGCTSGRIDDALADLEATALSVSARIDYAFLVPPASASACAGTLDAPADADSDGVGTRLFAAEPNPFAPACGPAPDPVCWVSDHSGVEVDLNCD